MVHGRHTTPDTIQDPCGTTVLSLGRPTREDTVPTTTSCAPLPLRLVTSPSLCHREESWGVPGPPKVLWRPGEGSEGPGVRGRTRPDPVHCGGDVSRFGTDGVEVESLDTLVDTRSERGQSTGVSVPRSLSHRRPVAECRFPSHSHRKVAGPCRPSSWYTPSHTRVPTHHTTPTHTPHTDHTHFTDTSHTHHTQTSQTPHTHTTRISHIPHTSHTP